MTPYVLLLCFDKKSLADFLFKIYMPTADFEFNSFFLFSQFSEEKQALIF